MATGPCKAHVAHSELTRSIKLKISTILQHPAEGQKHSPSRVLQQGLRLYFCWAFRSVVYSLSKPPTVNYNIETVSTSNDVRLSKWPGFQEIDNLQRVPRQLSGKSRPRSSRSGDYSGTGDLLLKRCIPHPSVLPSIPNLYVTQAPESSVHGTEDSLICCVLLDYFIREAPLGYYIYRCLPPTDFGRTPYDTLAPISARRYKTFSEAKSIQVEGHGSWKLHASDFL